MKRTTVAVILCALLAVAGACGSSKKDTTATEGAASAEKPSETTVSTATPTTPEPTTTTTAPTTSTTTASATPVAGSSEADFAAQANALCSKFNDQVAAVPQPTETTPAALGAYLDQALSLLDQQITELKALTPPASVSPAWSKVLQTIEAEQAQIKALVPKLKAGDTAAISQMQSISSDDINSQFDALGMTTCGSGSGG
jgi:hypothetical protein